MLLRSGRRLPTLEEAARETVPRRRRRARSDLFAGLPEEILLDILVRLPAKSVLRCRAVCQLWRRLASDPAFLLDHHRRQPVLPLVKSCGDSPNPRLEIFDLRAAELRPFFGFPDRASCDGLFVDSQHIFNPTTRQWAPLSTNPKIRVVNLVGLFRHQPSGEYRVLYWTQSHLLSDLYCLIEYRVLTVGTRNPRRVDCLLTLLEMGLINGRGPFICGAPVFLSGNLYVHWRKRSSPLYHKILVFDTVAESFRHMRPPAVSPRHVMHLFDMGGTLAASTSKDCMTEMRIFMLQDHEHGVWAFQYRIKLPVMDIKRFQEQGDWWAQVVSEEGDVLVACNGQLLHCDRNGKLVANFKCDDELPTVLPHRLKESLIQHTFFKKKAN
uniref:Uncharacterized protein n=1 Tax=Avena sativa TaxID=4498 RepID=A0ACD5YZE2_AVESA